MGGADRLPLARLLPSAVSGTTPIFDCLMGRQNVCHNIFAVLREDADFEEIFIDSTAVRAYQYAAETAKKRGPDSGTFSRQAPHQDSCVCRRARSA